MELQNLFTGFNRLQDFAIDPTDQYETMAEAEAYLNANNRIYKGQKLVVYNDGDNNGLYIVVIKSGEKSLSKLTNNEDFIKKIMEISSRMLTLESEMSDIEETYTHDNILEIIAEYDADFSESKYATKLELEEKINQIFGDDTNIDEKLDTIKEISEEIQKITENIDGIVETEVITGSKTKVPSSELIKDKFDEIEESIGTLSQALLDRLDGKI